MSLCLISTRTVIFMALVSKQKIEPQFWKRPKGCWIIGDVLYYNPVPVYLLGSIGNKKIDFIPTYLCFPSWLENCIVKTVTAGYSSDKRTHHAADATTEQYWKLLDDMQRNLVPILEPFLNRLKLNDSDDPNQKKFLSIKTQILPRLKVRLTSSLPSFKSILVGHPVDIVGTMQCYSFLLAKWTARTGCAGKDIEPSAVDFRMVCCPFGLQLS